MSCGFGMLPSGLIPLPHDAADGTKAAGAICPVREKAHMDQASFVCSIEPLSPHTGAEIRGIDLSKPVDAATRDGLNQAFLDHAVLAIRDQQLSATQFLEAMKVFGDVFPQHNSRFSVPECPQIHYISNQDKLEDGRVYIPGEGYHTDHSNDRARHVYQSKHSERKLPQLSADRKSIASESVIHPLVRTHPRTGRKAIYINPIRIEEIVGMDDSEALPLLDELLEHSTQLKFQYRHKWKSGDVVIWDNRCLMHKANGDYPVGEVRYLYRLMLKGGRPA
jgi:taurine dioxygenase